MHIDKVFTGDYREYFDYIWRKYPKDAERIMQRYENNMAFAAKDAMPDSLNSVLHIKNKQIVGFITKSIRVEKSTGKNRGATVGSMQYDENRRNYGRYMLERLYRGDRMKQADSIGKFRKKVFIGTKSRSQATAGHTIAVPLKFQNEPLTKQLRIGITMARKYNKNVLFTSKYIFGVYKTTGIQFLATIKPANTVPTRRIDWMQHAVDTAIAQRGAILQKSINYELSKRIS